MITARSSVLTYRALFLGLGFLLSAVSTHALSVRSLPVQAKESVLEVATATQPSEITPVQIGIPWKVNTSIQKGLWDGKGWSAPQDEAAYWIRGQNTIIYGHNTRQILGNIRALQGGEVVTIEQSDGSELFYRVHSIKEISATQTEWLEPTNKKVLTLYTCSGWWDKQRFVVRAELI